MARKFDEKVSFFLENYITAGTYAYCVGPKHEKTEKLIDENDGDLGKKTNEKTVKDAKNWGFEDQVTGRHPANLLVKRFRHLIVVDQQIDLNKLITKRNAEIDENECKIKTSKDDSRMQKANALINSFGTSKEDEDDSSGKHVIKQIEKYAKLAGVEL